LHNGGVLACHTLLGDEVPKDGPARRKFFAVEENLSRYFFETDYVYTFDYYQHYMNFATMNFEVSSYLKFATAKMVGDQPLILSMAKDLETSKYIWNFELWHSQMVEDISEQELLKTAEEENNQFVESVSANSEIKKEEKEKTWSSAKKTTPQRKKEEIERKQSFRI